MKSHFLCFVFGLLLSNSDAVLAQGNYYSFQGYDLDTAQLEWSAIGSSADFVIISTVEQPDAGQTMGMQLGNIRLRWYTIGPRASQDPSFDTTFHFKGHARVSQIRSGSFSQFYLSGAFKDTLIVGVDTLINSSSGILTPFVLKIDRNGVLWHWYSPQAQHSFVQNIRTGNEPNFQFLAVGREHDTAAFMLSLDTMNGSVLWKEIVGGTNLLGDIMLTYRHTTDILISGICSSTAQPFGLNLPIGLPNTPYRAFLYKRNLSSNTAQFMKVVALNSNETMPEIKDVSNNLSFEFYWATPAFLATNGYLLSRFRLTPQAVYTPLDSIFSPLTGSVYCSQLGATGGGSEGGGKAHFGVFTNQGINLNEIKLSFFNGFPNLNTDFNLSVNSTSPWLGRYELAQIWLASKFGNSLNYSNFYNPNGSINFPGIDNQHPRWAIIRTAALTSVQTTKNELAFESFPNPVENKLLTIRFSAIQPIETHWFIYDSLGKIILKGRFSTPETTLDLKELQSGLYLLEINHNNQKAVRKVVLP